MSQTVICPPNIDFELGNFSNWYLYTGSCCPISTPVFSGPVANRHTITSGTSLDPYGNFPIADPTKGIYSLKLGNDQVNAQAERARYYVRIPNNANNYSLLLKYAVVLENPSHTPAEQPRFEVNAYDSATNLPITCSQFSFVASSVLPGFALSNQGTDVYYKPWSMASLNLSGYAGKTVAVDFASGDCSKGKHFGYGYVDINCVLFEISSIACKGTTLSTVSAPPGFQHYKWYDSTFSTLLDTNQVGHVPTPATFNKYHVVLTAYPGYGCDDTLSTTLYTSDLFLKTTEDTLACKNKPIQIKDSAFVSARFQPITYNWNPSTNLSCSTCLNPIATPNISSDYKLTATDAFGCVAKDSFRINIILDSISLQPVSAQKCVGSSHTFYVKGSRNANYRYQWYKNATKINLANADSLYFPSLLDSDSGTYFAWVSWTCDSAMSDPAMLQLFPTPKIFNQSASAGACIGDSVLLWVQSSNNGIYERNWLKNGIPLPAKQSDSLLIFPMQNSDTGFYQFRIIGTCDTLYSDTIRVSTLSNAGLTGTLSNQYACSGDTVKFICKGNFPSQIVFSWKKNGVLIPGATNDSLVLIQVSLNDTGMYRMYITSSCSYDSTEAAYLYLNQAITFSNQPVSQQVCEGNSLILTVKSEGTNANVWYKNYNKIPNPSNDSLIINQASALDSGLYYVVGLGACSSLSSDTIQVTVNSLPIGNLKDTIPFCLNNSLIELPGFSSYRWSNGDTAYQTNLNQTGWVKVLFTDNKQCQNTDSTYGLLLNKPTIQPEPNLISCNLVAVALTANIQNYDSLLWSSKGKGVFSNPNGLNTNFLVDSLTIGMEQINLEAYNFCGTTSTQFTIDFLPKKYAYFIPEDTLVCENDPPVNLLPLNSGGVFSGSMVNGTVFNPIDTGSYLISYAISDNGCSDLQQQQITVLPRPNATFGYLPIFPTVDLPVVFTPELKQAKNYLWDFGNGQILHSIVTEHLFEKEGDYLVTLWVNNERCADSSTANIRILGSNYIWAPNAFTPNGDKLNDTFKILYKNSRGGSLQIYDRFGEMLYSNQNLDEGWDGTFQGKPCPNGVYFFVVYYSDNLGQTKTLSGNVTLLN